MYVSGHVYEFSPKEICDFLKMPMYGFNEVDKTYLMDVVVLKLLVTEFTWPKNNSLRASKNHSQVFWSS